MQTLQHFPIKAEKAFFFFFTNITDAIKALFYSHILKMQKIECKHQCGISNIIYFILFINPYSKNEGLVLLKVMHITHHFSQVILQTLRSCVSAWSMS